MFAISPPCLETYSPLTAFLPLGIEKSHTGLYLVHRGAAALVGSDVKTRNSGQSGTSGQGCCHGSAASHLTSMMQVAVPHCFMQLMEIFDIVLLVISLTIWCVLMVNNAFVIEDNCQYHFHLALNLARHFCPWLFFSGLYP